MSHPDGVAVPGVYRWLLGIAGRLAPRAMRQDWHKRWNTRLFNLCILVERGEVAGRDRSEMLLLCRDAWSNAFWLRFDRAGFGRWILGPQFVLTLAVAAGALLALVSHGFQATRSIVYAAIYWNVEPIRFVIGNRHVSYSSRGDLVVGYGVPFALALGIGAALFIIGRLSLGRYGWRYWLYLAAKTAAAITLVPLLWIEASGWLRAMIASEVLRAWVAGVGVTVVFLGGFGLAVVWVFDDQRRRCPVCLRRLARPVTMGSWASMFEPATTEFLCDEGHGALSLAENENSDGDRWVALDASWRDF